MGPESRRMCLTFIFALSYLLSLLNPLDPYSSFSFLIYSNFQNIFARFYSYFLLSTFNGSETFNET